MPFTLQYTGKKKKKTTKNLGCTIVDAVIQLENQYLFKEKRRVGWGWMAVGKGDPFTYAIASTGWITTGSFHLTPASTIQETKKKSPSDSSPRF